MDTYGELTFSLKVMRNYLSQSACHSLSSTICQGHPLDPAIADEVADAMKTWAMEMGATHYTHWFQPLTGATAEKHDSFLSPDHEGGVVAEFSGKALIQGEPDASSFPSGGLRATFEARGYTAWDPTSPAFIKREGERATLCIPTAFCGYHGEALGKKAPLLRSMAALSEQVCRLAHLFGIETDGKRARATLGVEQEYFLIDKRFHDQRLDLIQTGRTLFGRSPAKHQQMDDHYFGAIKPRVMAFMQELDEELWRLAIPSTTRHNEVSPAQFELACVFEELNLAVDHNMILMQVLRDVADRHGFACLMHEKPFAGVNGSGKHNNWSVDGPDGKNWLKPGDNPRENAKFLAIICAIMKGVDENAGLLRASVASAGNDHRLGANEAPPAILSIFLGDELCEIIEQLESGAAGSARNKDVIEIGVSSLPPLPRDTTDRNRTSPFAFCGRKFEFRAVGSSMNCAGSNIVLNTIIASAVSDMCDEIETEMKGGRDFNEALQDCLRAIVTKHKRILFNGDNYTAEWKAEAAARGLPDLVSTPEALESICSERSVVLFEKFKVLSRRELEARYEVYEEAYRTTVQIEAELAVQMARTMIAPAALEYEGQLADSLTAVAEATSGAIPPVKRRLLARVAQASAQLLEAVETLEAAIEVEDAGAKLNGMLALRVAADELEGLVPAELWPLPTYAEMLFMM
ncbi:MAG: glutamine synthetase III [Lentisphaeria bacterium]|nr:glutamine synthetase III [Lentisphaeria bacterium]